MLVVAAVIVGVTGVAMTAHALRSEPRPRAPAVRALEPRELPADLPAELQPDALVTRPVVTLLDSLRRMDYKPRTVEWLHFRCIEAAAVLTARLEGDARAFRAGLVEAFPASWTRTTTKDGEYVRSPDGRVEIAIPDAPRDAVDELAASLRPAHVIALAYHLRPC
jgi:hypothetical protein